MPASEQSKRRYAAAVCNPTTVAGIAISIADKACTRVAEYEELLRLARNGLAKADKYAFIDEAWHLQAEEVVRRIDAILEKKS